jgi:hypothetical protein
MSTGRSRGAEFFLALAAAAPILPDGALQTICNAIDLDIDTGRVRPDMPGLAQLREHVTRSRAWAATPGTAPNPLT